MQGIWVDRIEDNGQNSTAYLVRMRPCHQLHGGDPLSVHLICTANAAAVLAVPGDFVPWEGTAALDLTAMAAALAIVATATAGDASNDRSVWHNNW